MASVRAAEDAVKAAHAERLPNLTLTADYGAAGLRPGAEDHGVFTVSGTLTIPLYEGGRIRGDSSRPQRCSNSARPNLKTLAAASIKMFATLSSI